MTSRGDEVSDNPVDGDRAAKEKPGGTIRFYRSRDFNRASCNFCTASKAEWNISSSHPMRGLVVSICDECRLDLAEQMS